VAGRGIGDGTGNSNGELHSEQLDEMCGTIARDGNTPYEVLIMNSTRNVQDKGQTNLFRFAGSLHSMLM
jgi:hypothetical protein